MSTGSSVAEDRYFGIPLEHLEPATVPGFDLYLRHAGGAPVLYRAGNMEFTDAIRQRLLGSGVTELLVPVGQAGAYRAYREQCGQTAPTAAPRPKPELPEDERSLPEVLEDRARPVAARAYALLGVSQNVVRAALSDLGSPGLPQRVHHVAEATARFLLAEPDAYSTLVRMLRVDYETYSHSIHTALYTTHAMVGCRPGLEDLAVLGRAALVHDVGKAQLPRDLLRRGEPLEYTDAEAIKTHTDRGLAMLREAGWDDPVCLDVCANHHERCDGSGYPRGLSADQISTPARLIGICDTFDMLTTSLTGRPALSGFQTLWRMKREMAGQFDTQLLDRFIEAMVDSGPVRH
ncbi:MAG: HD domain-containing protein [Acidobacteria bacterium]|nr:HD domain-containing protein [Acidobacteriota bacterium]